MGRPLDSPGVDVLSDILRTVRLTGALFFLVDGSSPWVEDVPAARTFSGLVLPGAQHLISYHIVIRGRCWGTLAEGGGRPVALRAGDVLVIPHGDPYAMSSAPGLRAASSPDEVLAFFRGMAGGRSPFVIAEGGGASPRLQLLCGFLGCDARPFNPVLNALPPLLHLPRAAARGEGRLRPLVDLALREGAERRPGRTCALLRLSELLFVEVVRRHLVSARVSGPGLLAALRDPPVATALGLMHERPRDPWTLARLARESGASRSALAERFVRAMGQPPMQYLAGWRMQLASRLLLDGGAKVGTVGLEVGYDSEAAFSRAFKRIVGRSPAAWRREGARPA